MSKILFKAQAKQYKYGYLIMPATAADKRLLDAFLRECGQNYITVTANNSRRTKSYDQCKTIFALINIAFELNHDRKPTDSEQALVYTKYLWKYADRVEDPDDPENTIPISLSHMDKIQASHFISSIMADIYEHAHGTLNSYQEIELKEIFEEFNNENGFGNKNPVDYNENGELLSEDEWRKKNNFSFASGIIGTEETPLHLHHIITRGARKDLIDNPTNWIMLTAEEHMLYHSKGWDVFLSLYPHCAGRIKNDFETNHHPMPFDLQTALIKMGLLDSIEDEND